MLNKPCSCVRIVFFSKLNGLSLKHLYSFATCLKPAEGFFFPDRIWVLRAFTQSLTNVGQGYKFKFKYINNNINLKHILTLNFKLMQKL